MDRCEDCLRMRDVLYLLVMGILVCGRCWNRHHNGAKLECKIYPDMEKILG